jgi:succinate-semialdehyde dehydrogenase/glutarate-semialdehyde dehydrogenase
MTALESLPSSLTADERALLDGVPTDLLIGGAWRSAMNDRRFSVVDPSTGGPLALVADAAPSDALMALDAAENARADWAATTPRARADLLMAAYEAVTRRTDELSLLITLEMGKPLAESHGEVAYGADYLRWYAEEAVREGGRITLSPDGRSTITTAREPVGPCLLITPWNFPLAMGLRKLAPALAAGCTMVLKPAELTPLTSLLVAAILTEVGLPAGVCNVVTTTDPAAVSRVLMADPHLRKVSFTGSTTVGQLLLEQSAQNVLRASMELGGNAPLVIFDDADLDRAVDGAVVAKLRNGGQSCIAANRILVQNGIADAFVERFVARLEETVVGRGTAAATSLGPLIDERAVAKASRLVDDAVARGAHLLCGGAPPDGPGSFFPPTVLDGIPDDAAILQEEIFGPVAPIVRFTDEAEALRRANATPFGLAAYVFTESLDRAARVGAGLEAGMVGINQGLVSSVAAPFGGIKHSGLGREGGAEGLDEYLNIKYVAQAAPRAA